MLVFTAGIGEHLACMRRRICEHFGWMGVDIDAAANTRGAARISAPTSRVDVLVIPTDEEVVIARMRRLAFAEGVTGDRHHTQSARPVTAGAPGWLAL